MTTWEDVAKKVRETLVARISYLNSSKITIIPSVSDYFGNNTAQTTIDDMAILISPAEGSPESTVPMIGGWFRRQFQLQIAVISKMDANATTRIWGSGKKGFFDVRADIVSALEHSNLAGFVDNKAGVNFDVPWSILPLEGRAFTGYSTIYTAVKTEK